ncbi:hypothetical protein [Methylocella tundrae]|uniref:hypothetical protein n=1 Tax=Methylocella tundrae TaxID=227605 RepID=UPI00106A7763|nr:hypothetical protein [Methylocella tundrae]WPP05239.1 hypothetical protein SIN04_05270 [Methylocella tundrae]
MRETIACLSSIVDANTARSGPQGRYDFLISGKRLSSPQASFPANGRRFPDQNDAKSINSERECVGGQGANLPGGRTRARDAQGFGVIAPTRRAFALQAAPRNANPET